MGEGRKGKEGRGGGEGERERRGEDEGGGNCTGPAQPWRVNPWGTLTIFDSH